MRKHLLIFITFVHDTTKCLILACAKILLQKVCEKYQGFKFREGERHSGTFLEFSSQKAMLTCWYLYSVVLSNAQIWNAWKRPVFGLKRVVASENNFLK